MYIKDDTCCELRFSWLSRDIVYVVKRSEQMHIYALENQSFLPIFSTEYKIMKNYHFQVNQYLNHILLFTITEKLII